MRLQKLKNNKTILIIIYVLLRLSVISVMLIQFFNKNYNDVFLCVLTLVLFLIPDFVERQFKIELPNTLQIVIILFIYSAEILGEIRGYYVDFNYWDSMLHIINGFLMAAIGFSLIDILNRIDRIHFVLSPVFVAIVAFCFSMTIGVMWEFFEFTADVVVITDMQKDTVVNSISSVYLNDSSKNTPIIIDDIQKTTIISNGKEIVIDGGYLDIGLYDTMEDLIVNFIGAFMFSVLGLFYIKNRGEGKLVSSFIFHKKKL